MAHPKKNPLRRLRNKIRGWFGHSPTKQPRLSREAKLLAHIAPQGYGVEIGPAFRPVAPRAKGFNVTIIDHADRGGLVAKYGAQGIDCSLIEEVDHVWQGQTYAELTGQRNHYDWIIASHVIEHSTDFIGFLQQCEEILKPGGCVSLAIPDKRFCFDKFRPKTGLARIIDSHHHASAFHTEGTVAEYFLGVVRSGGQIAWSRKSGPERGDFAFAHSTAEAIEARHAAQTQSRFIDVHAWTFTPNSFRLLIHDLHLLGYTKLQEKAFHDTANPDHEFFVTLEKSDAPPMADRLALAMASYQEGY